LTFTLVSIELKHHPAESQSVQSAIWIEVLFNGDLVSTATDATAKRNNSYRLTNESVERVLTVDFQTNNDLVKL
jgi:hypothetical protein